MKNNDRVAVVTGGGGVIGSSICLALAQTGTKVVVVDIDEAHADKCAEALRSSGFRTAVVIRDLSNKTEVARMKDEIESEFGRVDILIHAHGDNKNELLFKIEEITWKPHWPFTWMEP